MRLQCNDGITRDFEIAHGDGDPMLDGTRHEGYTEAHCKLCGYKFGCHDIRVLKSNFRRHACIKVINLKENKKRKR